MPRSTLTERRTIDRFQPRYSRAITEVERLIERAAIGGDVGANGYTTLSQARRIGAALGLGPGHLLLDIGCGRGYPGLQLARATGCSVIGIDLPVDSLRAAGARARRERIAHRASFVAGSAAGLPFQPRTFDAITHTDVLC